MPFLAIRRRSILRLWIIWIISVGRERSFVHKATKPSRFFGVFSCINRVDKMMAVLAKCIQIDVKQCRPCWSHVMYTSESEQSSWYRSRRVGHWSWTKIILYHCRHHFRLHWACFGYVELVSPLLESNKSVFIQMSTKYRQLFQFLFKEGKHPMSLDSCLYMRIPMESLNIKCYVTPFLAAKIRNMFSKIGQSVL